MIIDTPRAPGPAASTRLVGVALALCVTAVGMSALRGSADARRAVAPSSPSAASSRAPLEVVVMLTATPTPRPADAPWPAVPEPAPDAPVRTPDDARDTFTAPPEAATRRRATRAQRAARDAMPRTPATEGFEAITPSDASSSVIAAPAVTSSTPSPAAASAPSLDLRKSVTDAAVRQARSPVRAMAQSSGAYTGTDPTSTSQAIAASVARSAKADCFGPNAQGSLLSIVTLVIDPLLDKCSSRR